MGAFFLNMLKKIRTKNKKKCRFARKAQKLLEIKSKRASELHKSPSKPSSSSKPSKASKLRNFCFFKNPCLQKNKNKKCLFAKSLEVAQIEKMRMNDPRKSTN